MTATAEYQSTVQARTARDSADSRLHNTAVAVAFVLGITVLWTLMHPYQGLYLDAQLYAVQALAKIHPAMGNDLYLQNVSQDRYTIFSSLYASLIKLLGLQIAAVTLFLACMTCLYGATWAVVYRLAGRDTAWLAVSMVVITGGAYGASHVFHFAEDFLTARSLAEMLIVAALACHFWQLKRLAVIIAAGALFVHPIMAFPGILLLACLWLPMRVSMVGALTGVFAAIIVAAAPLANPSFSRLFIVMDQNWLGIVRERAQFLFLPLWSAKDWELNIRPFICLAFTVVAVDNEQIRRLGKAAALVGATGLAVAYVASTVGPVPILLQGQAWRWVWIASLVSIMLLAPTAVRVWGDEKCGPLCVLLLILAWTFEATDVLLCSSLPLVLWLLRSHISARMGRYLRWTAAVAAASVLMWTMASSWRIISTPLAESGLQPALLQRIRYIFELDVSAVFVVLILWSWIRATRAPWGPALISAAFVVSLAFILPSSFKQITRVGSAADIEEFSDWGQRIPSNGSVYVAPAKDAGGFVWFTLGRPNYLSPSQSAGVVFSRDTALEVRRRSEVLLPVADPDWKIFTSLSRTPEQRKNAPPTTRPLTTKSLMSMCSDLSLGFVISPENVGFDPTRHTHAGLYKNWNLYDCRHVRAIGSAT
jgi:hypothetical protein